jgi:histidyl-tRNA synthetase
MTRIQAIKGMPDVLPKDMPLWQKFETLWRKLMWTYGYDEIRFPVVEATGLFKRSIGEVTDIVEKEMFTFFDKDKESMTLRPEGTAPCVRAGIEHGLLYHNTQRLWYMGPMFRYEKPQKGRYRQFTHAGIEAFGFSGADIEVEQLVLSDRLWRWLGISEVVSLEINSLGSPETRNHYREALVKYFTRYQSDLDEDSQRRLTTNPLRILDSKNPDLSAIINDAPRCQDYLNAEDKKHFEELQQGLTELGITYQVNPRIVRGLDYYNRTVYEWVTTQLGAQGTVCAGGRYDGLVSQLGGDATPGVGFAIGIERVVLLLEALQGLKVPELDVYWIAVGERAQWAALAQAEKCRDRCPKIRMVVHCGGGSFKTQFKRADKSGAKIALILGENELASGTVGVKFLREEREQQTVKIAEVANFLNEFFMELVNGGVNI